MVGSLLSDIGNRNIDAQVEQAASIGTVNRFPAYLGKGVDDTTIKVPLATAEYPSDQLVYFYTLDTDDADNPRTRAFGSALNPSGFAQHGLPVWVARHLESGMMMIVGRRDDDAGFFTSAGQLEIQPTGQQHGQSHHLFGAGGGLVADPAFISQRQIREGMLAPTNPPSLTIRFLREQTLTVSAAGSLVGTPTTQTIDLTTSVPGVGLARWAAISAVVGLTGLVVNGNTFVPGASPEADFTSSKFGGISIPIGQSLIGIVYLKNGDTELDWDRIRLWNGHGPGDNIGVAQCSFIHPNPSTLTDDNQDDINSGCNLVLAGPITIETRLFVYGILRVI